MVFSGGQLLATLRGSVAKFVRALPLACLATVTLPAAATAATPTLMWSGAKRVNVMCNVAGGPGIDHVALTSQLCREVEQDASKGSPFPIRTIMLGDPALLGADAVTLLVHGSIVEHGGARMLAFNIRPYRLSSEQSQTLFGSPPRAAFLPRGRLSGASFTAAIDAALSEVLPWRQSPKVKVLK